MRSMLFAVYNLFCSALNECTRNQDLFAFVLELSSISFKLNITAFEYAESRNYVYIRRIVSDRVPRGMEIWNRLKRRILL